MFVSARRSITSLPQPPYTRVRPMPATIQSLPRSPKIALSPVVGSIGHALAQMPVEPEFGAHVMSHGIVESVAAL